MKYFDKNEYAIKKFVAFIKENVKILWYELENESGNEAFIRINTNKIKLTQGDLVKAEFLRRDKDKFRKNISISKEQLGKEWDEIENNLFIPQFWFFISNKNTDDRISKLLEIVLNQKSNQLDNKFFYDENKVYNKFEKRISNDYDGTWNIIKETYYALDEWYQDIELYNLIGFLISIKNEEETEEWLANAVDKYYKCKNKEIFKKEFLLEEIKEKIFKDLENKNMEEIDQNIIKEQYLEKLDYTNNSNDKKKIINILLLHNILTLNKLKENKIKFAYDKYKNSIDENGKIRNWDIEHIHSQHDKKLEDDKDKDSYINYLKIYTINEALKKEHAVQDISEKLKKIENLKYEKYENVKQKGKEIIKFEENFDLNKIGNLVLLDSNTNRSYGNSLFMKKREEIIKKDEESFIPICTKNVFLKTYYNEDNLKNEENKNLNEKKDEIMQFFEWNSKDAKYYTEDIANKLYENLFIKM